MPEHVFSRVDLLGFSASLRRTGYMDGMGRKGKGKERNPERLGILVPLCECGFLIFADLYGTRKRGTWRADGHSGYISAGWFSSGSL